MRQILKISWALNCTFLMLSGSWNKAGPFWLIEAPETDVFWLFQEPEIVKKALLYFRGLKSSKRFNLRSLKLTKSSREPLWGNELNCVKLKSQPCQKLWEKKNTFYQSNSFLSLFPAETLKKSKFQMNQRKVIFPSIFDKVGSKVIQN